MEGQATEAASQQDDLASLVDNSFVEIDDEVDEQEEVEASADEAEQNDELADEQAANVEPQRIKLKLKNEQGEEVEEEFSPEELASGILRDRDYRHKTMALAEKERQATQIVQQQVEQAHSRLQSDLEMNQQIVDTLIGAFGNDRLEVLKAQDQVAWAEAMERKASLESARQYLQQKAQALKQEQAKMLDMQRQEMARSTWQVLSTSGITQKDVGEAFAAHKKYYGDLGDIDYNNILDPVSVMTIRDAVAYRQLKDAKPEVTKRVQAAAPMPKAKAPTPNKDRQMKQVDAKFKSGRASLRDLGDFIHLHRS